MAREREKDRERQGIISTKTLNERETTSERLQRDYRRCRWTETIIPMVYCLTENSNPTTHTG